jgi:trehalose 6-phosphate synthase/phosphatase
LILLDYDGTLVPYFNSPQDAMPGTRLKGILMELASNPKNRVVIISGRDSKTLEQWFGDTPVDLVAEHGGFYRSFAEGIWNNPDTESSTWKSSVKQVFERWTSSVAGTFIEEKAHSIAWHYRTAVEFKEQEAIHDMVKDLMILNSNNRFKVMCGNKIVEVKSSSFDKGSFAMEFIQKHNFDFVLAIGDDITDEDMFEKLRAENHYTIRVGLGQTKAMYNLIGVNNVHSFLEQLAVFKNVLS